MTGSTDDCTRRQNTRRAYLAGTTLWLSALAGCTSDGSSGDDPDDAGGPDDDIGNYDPTDVAERYYEALDAGDEATLTELSHSEGIEIENVSNNADTWGEDGYSIDVKRAEVLLEDLEYFYYPSAVVDVGFDQGNNGNTFATSHEVILVVEDGELRVFDTKGSDTGLQTGEPDGPCPPEDDEDAMANLPRTNGSFYRVKRNASFDSGDAYYRGPKNNRFHAEITVHETVEEAQSVEANTDGTTQHGNGDESWTARAYLVARNEAVTCELDVDNASAAERLDTLYEQVNCFAEDHVEERT